MNASEISMTYRISGEHAVRLALRDGLKLRKAADPVSGYEEDITAVRALEVMREDPALVYVIVRPAGWTGEAAGYQVTDYFRGSLQGHALSGATYLGPDDDGVEPVWIDSL